MVTPMKLLQELLEEFGDAEYYVKKKGPNEWEVAKFDGGKTPAHVYTVTAKGKRFWTDSPGFKHKQQEEKTIRIVKQYIADGERGQPIYRADDKSVTKIVKEAIETETISPQKQKMMINAATNGDRVVIDGKTVWGGLGNRSGLHSYAQVAIDDKWKKSGPSFEKKLKTLEATKIEFQRFRNINRDRGRWVTYKTL